MPRFYTVEEANARLPELTGLLLEMREQGRQLATIHERTSDAQKKMAGNGHHNPLEDASLSQNATALEEVLRSGLEQLAKWSIELKDIERGLVDFPAEREGRTVYLCWQLGEPEVAFWHELDTGFAGRQPLDDKMG